MIWCTWCTWCTLCTYPWSVPLRTILLLEITMWKCKGRSHRRQCVSWNQFHIWYASNLLILSRFFIEKKRPPNNYFSWTESRSLYVSYCAYLNNLFKGSLCMTLVSMSTKTAVDDLNKSLSLSIGNFIEAYRKDTIQRLEVILYSTELRIKSTDHIQIMLER